MKWHFFHRLDISETSLNSLPPTTHSVFFGVIDCFRSDIMDIWKWNYCCSVLFFIQMFSLCGKLNGKSEEEKKQKWNGNLNKIMKFNGNVFGVLFGLEWEEPAAKWAFLPLLCPADQRYHNISCGGSFTMMNPYLGSWLFFFHQHPIVAKTQPLS